MTDNLVAFSFLEIVDKVQDGWHHGKNSTGCFCCYGFGKSSAGIGTCARVSGRLGNSATLRTTSEWTLEVWDRATVRVCQTIEDNTKIVFGLHSVRLGGPFLSRTQ